MREVKNKLKIYEMIEMMFCDSDSVIWDIQHIKSYMIILSETTIMWKEDMKRIEEENSLRTNSLDGEPDESSEEEHRDRLIRIRYGSLNNHVNFWCWRMSEGEGI